MSEKFKCPNILRYDQQLQQYVHCDHIFTVDGANSGKVVQCPTCGGEVRLGSIDLSRADTLLEEDLTIDVSPPASDGGLEDLQLETVDPASSAARNVQQEPTAPDDIFGESAGPAASDVGSPDAVEFPEPLADLQIDDLEIEPPASGKPVVAGLDDSEMLGDFFSADHMADAFEVKSDVAEKDPDAVSETPSPTSQRSTTLQMDSFCPGCGKHLPQQEVLCPSCGYHRRLQRQVRIRDVKSENEPRGVHLWLQNSLAEGTSVQGVLLLMCGLVMGVLLLAAVVTFVAAGLWALIFLPLIALAAILMTSLVAGSSQTQESGVTGWVQRVLWAAMLFVFRLTRWQICTWPPGGTVVKRVRDVGFDDEALLELAGLDQCHVIDLEECGITDEGLLYLTAYPQLRFIVLRKTQVSDKAVRRLQRAFPAAWIWH